MVGLILDALMNFQSQTKQPDPLQLTAYFLRPGLPGPFEIHVEAVKPGKQFSNFKARFIQKVSFLDFT